MRKGRRRRWRTLGVSILDDPTITGSTLGMADVFQRQFLVSRQAGGCTQIPSSVLGSEHKQDGRRNPQPAQPTHWAYSEEVLQEIMETRRFVMLLSHPI